MEPVSLPNLIAADKDEAAPEGAAIGMLSVLGVLRNSRSGGEESYLTQLWESYPGKTSKRTKPQFLPDLCRRVDQSASLHIHEEVISDPSMDHIGFVICHLGTESIMNMVLMHLSVA